MYHLTEWNPRVVKILTDYLLNIRQTVFDFCPCKRCDVDESEFERFINHLYDTIMKYTDGDVNAKLYEKWTRCRHFFWENHEPELYNALFIYETLDSQINLEHVVHLEELGIYIITELIIDDWKWYVDRKCMVVAFDHMPNKNEIKRIYLMDLELSDPWNELEEIIKRKE